MRELYVYYRIAGTEVREARQCVDRFQSELRVAHPGLGARLLRRDGAAVDEPTWMEVYRLEADDGAGVTSALDRAIEDAASPLRPFLRSARHSEGFVPCAS